LLGQNGGKQDFSGDVANMTEDNGRLRVKNKAASCEAAYTPI
jgi:hypothetical protein